MLRGGSENFQTPKRGPLKKLGGGGSENVYTSKPTGEGGLLKNRTAEPLVRGAAKISSFEFQYVHPPPLSY